MYKSIIIIDDFVHFKSADSLSGPKELKLNRKQRLNIFSNPYYDEALGYIVPLEKDDGTQFFMLTSELERYYMTKLLSTEIDIELEVNFHSFKINQALDGKDRDAFQFHTEMLQNRMELLKDETVKV